MQFIDSHAHLNSTEFKENWKNIVATAKNAGLSAIINIAGDRHDSEWGIQQANQEPIVYATVGEHPEALTGQEVDTDELINNLRRLISNSQKVVGIGEIGLDYTLDPTLAPKSAQIELIKPQLQLAQELHLPVVLHVRDQPGQTDCFNDLIDLLQQFTTSNTSLSHPGATGDRIPAVKTIHRDAIASLQHDDRKRTGLGSSKTGTAAATAARPSSGSGERLRHENTNLEDDIAVIAPYNLQPNPRITLTSNQQADSEEQLQATHNLTGIFHCWTGTPDQLATALELPDFYISFSGILTYKSAGHILDAAKLVPDDRLLVETDAPYLMPEPRRSLIRKDKTQFPMCQPADVIITAQKLADIRGQSLEHIARVTAANARQVFKLP